MSMFAVGPIETNVPLPPAKERKVGEAEQRILELPVGGSFVIRHLEADIMAERVERWGMNPREFSAASEANRLRIWAAKHRIKLLTRKIDGVSHRLWRIS